MSTSFLDRYTAKVPDRFFNIPEQYNPYRRAHENRIGIRHPDIQKIRGKFFKAVFGNFVILQILFLALFCYIFGALFTQNEHVHNVKIQYIDYDGGVVGQSVTAGYERLKRETFPTLVEMPSPTGDTPVVGVLTSQVCQNQYWATIYTHPGASDRLAAALSGGAAAADYDPNDVLTFVWNEARYPTAADSAISANMQSLSAAARVAYTVINGTAAINSLNRTDSAAVAAYSNPWQLQNINIKPTVQGSRAIYNTLCIVLILIQEFFYLAALNGMYGAFRVYERLYPHRIIFFRQIISIGYCFMGSLFVTAAIFIFRDGWDVGGGQFALTWMIIWLFAHTVFLVLDAITVWVPQAFVPNFLITWIVINVTSILLPFELVPGFYKWGYALPAHCVYGILLGIWSGGCNPQLEVNLPILFAWELVGMIVSGIGVHRRCHYAVIAQEAQERQFQEKLQSALDFEKKRDAERAAEREREKEPATAGASTGSREREEEEEREVEEEAKDRADLENELRMERSLSRREMQKIKTGVNFGPSFSNPFGGADS